MICPKCNSEETKKVSTTDTLWQIGHERCKKCNYQAHWFEFIQQSKSVIIK